MQKYDYIPVKVMKADDAVEGFFILKDPALKATQAGKKFFQAVLADATGQIDSIFWDCEEDSLLRCAGRIEANEEHLSAVDAAIGDGDHGIGMANGI